MIRAICHALSCQGVLLCFTYIGQEEEEEEEGGSDEI